MDTQVQGSDTLAPSGESVINEFDTIPIPETYKGTAVGKYATFGELVKGYENAQKLIGAKGVILPTDKSTPEEVEKFYNSIGRPEKPDGYNFTKIENLHPQLQMTPESEAQFKALVHKHGLTAKQADGLYKDYFGMLNGAMVKKDQEAKASTFEAEKALRSEWQGDYDKNLAGAKRLVDKFGGADAREAFGELGNNPQVLKTLANISKHFAEDTFVKGGDPVPEVVSAKQKLTEIFTNKDHPYWKQGVGHDDAVKEVMRLQEIVTPNEREATRQ